MKLELKLTKHKGKDYLISNSNIVESIRHVANNKVKIPEQATLLRQNMLKTMVDTYTEVVDGVLAIDANTLDAPFKIEECFNSLRTQLLTVLTAIKELEQVVNIITQYNYTEYLTNQLLEMDKVRKLYSMDFTSNEDSNSFKMRQEINSLEDIYGIEVIQFGISMLPAIKTTIPDYEESFDGFLDTLSAFDTNFHFFKF